MCCTRQSACIGKLPWQTDVVTVQRRWLMYVIITHRKDAAMYTRSRENDTCVRTHSVQILTRRCNVVVNNLSRPSPPWFQPCDPSAGPHEAVAPAPRSLIQSCISTFARTSQRTDYAACSEAERVYRGHRYRAGVAVATYLRRSRAHTARMGVVGALGVRGTIRCTTELL